MVATPPDRQLSPPHGQLTSFAASVSRQQLLFDANRGEIAIVFSRAVREESCRQRRPKIIIGVPSCAVHDDQRSRNLFVFLIQRIIAVNE